MRCEGAFARSLRKEQGGRYQQDRPHAVGEEPGGDPVPQQAGLCQQRRCRHDRGHKRADHASEHQEPSEIALVGKIGERTARSADEPGDQRHLDDVGEREIGSDRRADTGQHVRCETGDREGHIGRPFIAQAGQQEQRYSHRVGKPYRCQCAVETRQLQPQRGQGEIGQPTGDRDRHAAHIDAPPTDERETLHPLAAVLGGVEFRLLHCAVDCALHR